MNIFDRYKVLLDELQALPKTKARDNAIQRLEESAFWTSATVTGVESPLAWSAAKDPPVKKPGTS